MPILGKNGGWKMRNVCVNCGGAVSQVDSSGRLNKAIITCSEQCRLLWAGKKYKLAQKNYREMLFLQSEVLRLRKRVAFLEKDRELVGK
jgi:hypothetical protein